MVLQGTEGKLGTIDVAMYGRTSLAGHIPARHENGFLKGRTFRANCRQLFPKMRNGKFARHIEIKRMAQSAGTDL